MWLGISRLVAVERTFVMDMKSCFFDTESVRLHYVEGENGRFSPLVLLHGTTNRWQDFAPILPALTAVFHTFVLDLRGHGMSGRVAGGYRVLDFARDVAAFVREVVGQPTLLWGHSLGGLVGIAVAAQQPEWVRGLVIEDSPLFLRRANVENGSPRAYAFFRAVHAAMGLPAAQMAAQLTAALPSERATGIPALVERLPFVDPDVVRMSFDSSLMNGLVLDDCLRQIRCPTLLVQADAQAGGALLHEDVVAVLGLLRNGRLHQFPNTGHAVHAERPLQLAKLVGDWSLEIGD